MNLLKIPRFPCRKRLRNKAHLNLATEVLKVFSPSGFNGLCVTQSKSSNRQKFRNLSTQTVERKHGILNFLRCLTNLQFSTQTVNGKHSVYKGLGSSENCVCQLWQLTGMLTLAVNMILLALKATIRMNVSPHCLQDFGSSKS